MGWEDPCYGPPVSRAEPGAAAGPGAAPGLERAAGQGEAPESWDRRESARGGGQPSCRRFLWLPWDIAGSGEVPRRGAGACGRAEPPAAPQDAGNLAARAPGYVSTASLPAAGPGRRNHRAHSYPHGFLPCASPCPSRHVGRTTAPAGGHRAGDSHGVPVCRSSCSPRHTQGWGLSPDRLGAGLGVPALPAALSPQLHPACAGEGYRGTSGGGSAPLAEKASVFLQLQVRGEESVEPRGSPLAEEKHILAQVLCRRAAPPPSLVPRRDDHGQGHAAERDGCRTEEPLPGDGLRRRDQQGDRMHVVRRKPRRQWGRAALPVLARGYGAPKRAPNAHPR